MCPAQLVRKLRTNWNFDHFVDVNNMIGDRFTTGFASLLFHFLQ